MICLGAEDLYEPRCEACHEVAVPELELEANALLARMTDERPNLNLLANRCAEWFGGVAREQYDLVLAIAALAHGTAMLTISGVVRKEHSRRAHDVCLRSLEVLAKHRKTLSEA